MTPGPLASVGFGCAGLAQLPDERGRQALLEAAYESGIRHFDVARMYGLGTAEGVLGRFLAGREGVTVTTKFGLSFSAGLQRASGVQSAARWVLRRVPALRSLAKRRFAGSTERDFSVEATRASIAASLEALGIGRVDYLFLHDPMGVDEVPSDLPSCLASLVADGTVGQIGLATAREPAEAIAAHWPALGGVVQIPAPDSFSNFLADPGRRVFTHGHLPRWLTPLKEGLVRTPEKALNEAFGLATLSGEALGAAILLRAYAENPRGKALFFSSNPVRVRETMRLVGLCDDDAARRVGVAVARAVGS